MAVVECIPEKKQTPSAQKGVIDYCIQPSKTYDNDEQLAYVSGYNCIPELANESFLATQKVYGHEPDGVRFYHYVQSFRIGEEITPQEAHEIGMEFAKSFGNHEVDDTAIFVKKGERAKRFALLLDIPKRHL